MKKFFKINEKYRFEWGDLRALLFVINVALIIAFGLSVAWYGLTISLIGIVIDLVVDRHINGLVIDIASVVLNTFFLCL